MVVVYSVLRPHILVGVYGVMRLHNGGGVWCHEAP